MANDPIHQFQIQKFFSLGEVGGVEFAMTNSALFMIAIVLTISAFLILSTSGRGLVPTRWQSMAELMYELVASTLRNTAGTEGMKFFPFVFSLFAFVLFANLIGLMPYFFTVTSHLVVTGALALLVISVVIIYGFMRNGFGFLKLFVPSGLPVALAPFIALIEVLSFLSRPVSLSLRLFGNMLAGHIVLKVFAGFVVSLSAAGALGWFAALFPFALTVALTALEFLVAVLQAYVFTILTCVYLNDAIHPSH
ncbi:ATP synthase F0 subcomplex A subunit [Cohaesibacter sp. ES.047]|uniref:F0F1 ATP synthase subunit A n=1 Tax=Cohaesibacter sp. ES.047 TaxID=1798205 RepID=UPI000BB6C109|nr:F0F1 ATP synthase subunit A [Cohaesibacter sp. ES.047]SNY92545.1 ATP synthase F0 subcomplex A subunit [Cohaesibacter sp. ES.047]